MLSICRCLAVAGSGTGAHRAGGSMLLRSDAVKNKSRARTATNTWMCVGGCAELHTCTGSLDMRTPHNICTCRIMITHRTSQSIAWRTRLSRGAAAALNSRGSYRHEYSCCLFHFLGSRASHFSPVMSRLRVLRAQHLHHQPSPSQALRSPSPVVNAQCNHAS